VAGDEVRDAAVADGCAARETGTALSTQYPASRLDVVARMLRHRDGEFVPALAFDALGHVADDVPLTKGVDRLLERAQQVRNLKEARDVVPATRRLGRLSSSSRWRPPRGPSL
jgi:hypothetical protein